MILYGGCPYFIVFFIRGSTKGRKVLDEGGGKVLDEGGGKVWDEGGGKVWDEGGRKVWDEGRYGMRSSNTDNYTKRKYNSYLCI